MLRSSQVSVCWAWAQISLKTPSWSLETQRAGFRSGTSVTMHWTSSMRWVYVFVCESWCKSIKDEGCTVQYIPKYLFSFHTARLWAASSAAVLEGSWESISKCGSPGGCRQIVCPHSLSWRLCWTVDKGRRSCGFFRAGSDVEYHWASYLPEVRLIHEYMSNNWKNS